jgi:hypothetical protein
MFCFFVDGLDEFFGKPADLIDYLKSVAVLLNVKLCVASRPWPVFEDAFDQCPSLRL